MKVAFVIFDGITWLDFIGIYDPISRLKALQHLPDLTWDICSYTETVSDNFGLEIVPHKVTPHLGTYDVIIVPGGFGTRQLQFDTGFINWLRTAQKVPLKTSICTGSLLLGAAGFLKDKKATTNYQAYDDLKPYCEMVMEDRIVVDGNLITAGAVSSSLDLGLFLCEKWAGKLVANEIRQKMDYIRINE